MIPRKRVPTHPGVILLEEFLAPMGLSQAALARHLGISAQRVNAIVQGKRGISADLAWRLAGAFGTSPELWLNLQSTFDLSQTKPRRRVLRISGGDRRP